VLLGVLQAAQDLRIASGTLPHNIYLVKVDSGQIAFVNPQNQEIRSARSLDVRSFTRQLAAPRAILTAQDVCFGWNQVQVCGDPVPVPVDTQNNLQQAMAPVVKSLESSSRIGQDQIDVSNTLSEAEGSTAATNRRGNVLAAPAKSVTKVKSGSVPDNTLLGVFAVTGTIAASGYQVPAGNYAVISAGGSQAKLITTDGQTMTVPMNLVQVRAPASNQQDPPIAIIANFCFGSGGDTDVCFFGEGED
jgi:hypothetical protein